MNGGRLSRKTTKHGSDGDPNLTKSTEKPPTRPKKQPPQGKIIIMMIYLTKSTTKNTNQTPKTATTWLNYNNSFIYLVVFVLVD